jgi:hypothetical protein
MSYDLYFTAPKISNEDFVEYFTLNPLYKVSGQQAFYENENTGVYFSFDHNSEAPQDEDDIEHFASFNINFYRPHYFALEAEPEVRRFVEHFNCSIFDFQNEGMDKGPYSKEGFLKGWNNGNSFGYKAMAQHVDASTVVHTRSTHELEKIWNWNISLQDRLDESEEDIFIPRIFFTFVNGTLGTVCVWPDAISTLIPNVDYLFIPRKELAPKRLFKKQEDDYCILEQKDFPSFFNTYSTKELEFDAFRLPAPDTPRLVKDYVKSLKKFDGLLQGISNDQILNSELMESNR